MTTRQRRRSIQSPRPRDLVVGVGLTFERDDTTPPGLWFLPDVLLTSATWTHDPAFRDRCCKNTRTHCSSALWFLKANSSSLNVRMIDHQQIEIPFALVLLVEVLPDVVDFVHVFIVVVLVASSSRISSITSSKSLFGSLSVSAAVELGFFRFSFCVC